MPAAARLLQSAFREGPAYRAPAAIASGILAAHFVPFRSSELLAAIAAFLPLGVLAQYRGSRIVAGGCCSLGLFFGGALITLFVPAPRLSSTPRPRNRHPRRMRGRAAGHFGRARALPAGIGPGRPREVTLYTREGESLPGSATARMSSSTPGCASRATTATPALSITRISRSPDIYWTASERPAMCGFSPAAAARLSRRPRWICALPRCRASNASTAANPIRPA